MQANIRAPTTRRREEEEEEEQESLRQNRRSTTTTAAGGEQVVGGGEQQEGEDDADDEVICDKVVDVSKTHDADDSMRETVGTPSTSGLQQAATAFTAVQPSYTTPAPASAATSSLSSISPGGDACSKLPSTSPTKFAGSFGVGKRELQYSDLLDAQAALLSVNTNESTADYHFPENQVDSEYPHPRTELTLSPDKCGAISRDPNVKCWWVKPGTSMSMRLKVDELLTSRSLLRP